MGGTHGPSLVVVCSIKTLPAPQPHGTSARAARSSSARRKIPTLVWLRLLPNASPALGHSIAALSRGPSLKHRQCERFFPNRPQLPRNIQGSTRSPELHAAYSRQAPCRTPRRQAMEQPLISQGIARYPVQSPANGQRNERSRRVPSARPAPEEMRVPDRLRLSANQMGDRVHAKCARLSEASSLPLC